MVNPSSNIVRSKSQISYDYVTISITQSRIDKGLIAFPRSLVEWFPTRNETIQVYLDESPIYQNKNYSSYTSTTRECRIGGLKQWFQKNNIKAGDDIVIQLLDREHFVYRLIPERNFISETLELQYELDTSETEQKAAEKMTALAQWTHLERSNVALHEYQRLASITPSRTRLTKQRTSRARESVPANLRTILGDVYKGHCQVCDFWFLTKDMKPYFEIHHLDPMADHHIKNLVVVCGNCHNEFEYADVRHEFNEERWLIRVHFNRNIHSINQAIFSLKTEGFLKELFL